MSTFSFNGWPGYLFPSSPVPASVEWQLDDVIGDAPSPFSLQQQLQDWQQSRIRASVSMPLMSKTGARPFLAFLKMVRGLQGVFLFGDPVNNGPQNPSAVGGTVSGSGQTGYTLVTSGTSGLTADDWIQVGDRLYSITAPTPPDLGIWPPLRESPSNGTPLVLINPQGLFRLVKNQRSYSVKPGGIYQVTFEIQEAL